VYTAQLHQVQLLVAMLADQTSHIILDATAVVTAAGTPAAVVRNAVTHLRECYQALNEDLAVLLASDTPDAADLYRILAGLRIATAVHEMGELAGRIAGTADDRTDLPVVLPAGLRPLFTQLGRLCAEQARRLAAAVHADDPVAAAEQINTGTAFIDRVRRQLTAVVTDPGWPHGLQQAVAITVLSTLYDRYADQATRAAHILIQGYRVPPLTATPSLIARLG
jgi:phosphate transport system protein